MADGPGAVEGRTIEVLRRQLAEARAERDEAQAGQAALAEVLQAINASSGDFTPVFDMIIGKAMALGDAAFGALLTYADNHLTLLAHRNGPAALVEFWARPQRLDPGATIADVFAAGRTSQVADLSRSDAYLKLRLPMTVASVERGSIRTLLQVPLAGKQGPIGLFILYRQEVRPFDDRQIALLEAFAGQAIVALETARLLIEQREALEQQTATSDILRVISRSPTDVQPVLEVVASAARRFCGANDVVIGLREGDELMIVAHEGPLPTPAARRKLDRTSIQGRAVIDGCTLHHPDFSRLDPVEWSTAIELSRTNGFRSGLAVPMVRDGKGVGTIMLRRPEPGPFAPHQIALAEAFAAQAVIAIENVRLFTELKESLDQQTATAEILRAISQSPTDVRPVHNAVTEAALRFCGAEDVFIALRDGNEWVGGGHAGAMKSRFGARYELNRHTAAGRSILDGKTIHFPDILGLDPMEHADAIRIARDRGHRASLAAPMLREGEAIGSIVLRKLTVGPFSDQQIKLLQSFAAQAVIALENTRLFTELKESLDQQTAMAEVLGLINSSAGDITPVLDAMVGKAMALCEAPFGHLFSWDGEFLRSLSTHHAFQDTLDLFSGPLRIEPATDLGGILRERKTVQYSDISQSEAYRRRAPVMVAMVEQAGIRTMISVPLVSERGTIGLLGLYRRDVRPFTDKQVALVEAFAAQAVVAMENARLLGELTRREEELRVTFDHMGDGVAMFDADLTLASWNRNFQELLDIPDSFLAGRPDLEDYVRLLVARGEIGKGDADREIARYRARADQAWLAERARPDGRILEVRNNPVPGGGAVLIYGDITERKKAEADIAAARDAAEAALERQTATADILKVIASSPSETQPAFDAIAESTNRLMNGLSAAVWCLNGGMARLEAFTHTSPEGDEALKALSPTPVDEVEAMFPLSEGKVVQFADAQELPSRLGDVARRCGYRAHLLVPLMAQGAAIGFVSVTRQEAGAFNADDVQLLKTFADQAVIAIQNAQLFNDLRESLKRLRATQANLIQSEKMASLGQLTAGIAHEIKNPLNFVNNFATLSVDLLGELKEAAGPAFDALDEDRRAEVDETMDLLTGNLGKIAEHGKRADGIVKSMLSHSRGGAGDWQPSDINALVEEALNLAYHGARAQDREFNVTLERDFEKAGRPIDVVPQDVARVFLNLFGNGFYAANKRRLSGKAAGFKPTLRVATRDLGDKVEVRVRDNGIGMPAEVREKLFQPFFTTKPTGEGTGLGLSISYDIVTQQHGGTIEVESEPGNFTEFTVCLPRSRRLGPAEKH